MNLKDVVSDPASHCLFSWSRPLIPPSQRHHSRSDPGPAAPRAPATAPQWRRPRSFHRSEGRLGGILPCFLGKRQDCWLICYDLLVELFEPRNPMDFREIQRNQPTIEAISLANCSQEMTIFGGANNAMERMREI